MSEVTLKGLFLFLRVPSEEPLLVTMDASSLHPQVFLSLIHELQDGLRDMDEKYAENPEAMRERSVKARPFRSFHRREEEDPEVFTPSKHILERLRIRAPKPSEGRGRSSIAQAIQDLRQKLEPLIEDLLMKRRLKPVVYVVQYISNRLHRRLWGGTCG
jgi:hypothetical protein